MNVSRRTHTESGTGNSGIDDVNVCEASRSFYPSNTRRTQHQYQLIPAVVLPDSGDCARLRSLTYLLQFDPLHVLHVVMDHLQKSKKEPEEFSHHFLPNTPLSPPLTPPSYL